MMIVGLAGIVYDWGTVGRWFAVFCAVIGAIAMLCSMGVYFAAGMLSTSATVVQCPECDRMTKMLGKTDRCMYCKTILSLDPQHAPKESEDAPAPPAGDAGLETKTAHTP